MYERYLELLKETEKTTYGMCKETGLKQSAISAWKSGKTKPSQRTFQVIADYFGVNVEWLAGETDVRENKKPADHEIDGREKEFMQLFERLTPDQQDMILAQLRGVVSNQGK